MFHHFRSVPCISSRQAGLKNSIWTDNKISLGKWASPEDGNHPQLSIFLYFDSLPSSETQGLLVGTMRYFRASDTFGVKVYFKSWRAPGNFSYQMSSIRGRNPSRWLARKILFLVDRCTTSETFHDMQIAVARATQLCRPGRKKAALHISALMSTERGNDQLITVHVPSC